MVYISDGPVAESCTDYTQHSQATDLHAPGGIRTSNLNNKAAADPRPYITCSFKLDHKLVTIYYVNNITYIN